MRLPALTPEQIGHEDARAFHEAVYGSYLSGDPFVVLIDSSDSPGIVVKRHADRYSAYWRRRQFRLRQATTADRSGVRVWLEPRTRTED